MLDCHWALPASNLYSRTNVTAKHLFCCAFISFSPSAALLHHSLTVCKKSFLVSSAKCTLCFHVSPIPSSKLNILGHFRVICWDKKMPGRVLFCAEAAACAVPSSSACGDRNQPATCAWLTGLWGNAWVSALGIPGNPSVSQQGSHQHMGDHSPKLLPARAAFSSFKRFRGFRAEVQKQHWGWETLGPVFFSAWKCWCVGKKIL